MRLMLLLTTFIGFAKNENCTFLETIDHSVIDSNEIYINNTIITKLCTDFGYKSNKNDNNTYTFLLVNCEIKELGRNLFKNYHLFSFKTNHNSIRTLYSYTFYNIDIITIDLDSNGIENIEINAFCNLNLLESLSLNNNKIIILIPGSFKQMPLLKIFSASNNNISKLKKHTFRFIESEYFERINFCNNEITEIESFCFVNMHIFRLILCNNSLEGQTKVPFQNVSIFDITLAYTKIKTIDPLCDNVQYNVSVEYYDTIKKYKVCTNKTVSGKFHMGYLIFLAILLNAILIVVVVIIKKK